MSERTGYGTDKTTAGNGQINMWYTAREIAELSATLGLGDFPTTIRRVIDRAESENWISREREGRGGGKEYHFNNLPIAMQMALTSPETAEDQSEAHLSRIASENHLRLDPNDLKDSKVRSKLYCYERISSIPPYLGRTQMVKSLAGHYQVKPITIWRWIKEVEVWKNGRAKAESEIAGIRVALPVLKKFSAEAVRYGLSVYFENWQCGKKAAYDAMAKQAQAAGWKIGDYSNFTRVINNMPEEVKALKSKGSIGFELHYAPKIRRDWLSVPVYSVLCGDQHISDYQIYEPETGQCYTMQFYLWLDCSSRYWAGMWPSFGPYNRYTYGYSLREAVKIAKPQSVYTDWGAPEESKYSTQLLADLSNAGISTGSWDDYRQKYSPIDSVEKSKARALHPWDKPIENHMNIFEQMFKDRFIGGYRKRDADAWINKQRNTELKKLRDDNRLFTTQEFMEIVLEIVKSHNESPVRVQERDTPIIPAQVLSAGLQEYPRIRFDPDTVDMIFLPKVLRFVRQSEVTVKVGDGDVRRFYVEPYGGMRIRDNERVLVAVDPFDPDKYAIIMSEDGKFLCNAERHKMVRADDTEEILRRIRIRRDYMKWWKDAINELIDPKVGQSVRRIGQATKVAMESKKAKIISLEMIGDRKKANEALDRLYEEMYGT